MGPTNLGSISWQWYRGNSPIAGGTNGEDMMESMYTPAAGDVGSVLRATVMYDDDEGDDKTAQEDSANAARAAPVSNVPPTFPNQDPGGSATTAQTREVAENTPAGTNIGAPVVASDTDVLTYSLENPNTGDAAEFDINRATGHLITKAALNHEEKATYTVMVQATDPFEAMGEAQVTITVTDVNEAPTVTGAASIDHAENGIVLDVDAADPDANPAEYTASDPDMITSQPETLRWSLSGADASKFSITETGNTRTLSFKEAPAPLPDYESPGDSGGNNLYEVTVVVTDTKGNTDEQDVMVKVTNVEEMGEITLSTLQPRVGFLLTAALTDPDNITADSVSWQWYREAAITIDAQTFDPDGLPTNECDGTNTTNCSIKGATSAAYVPVDADMGNSLTAVATYTDGNGDGKDYAATATGPNNDVLANTINDAPVFPDMDPEMEGRQTAQERSVGENVPEAFGTATLTLLERAVGLPVVATNDDGGVLTYSLGGPDAASFSIIPRSGQLQTKAVLDKETKDTYTVTVTATDSFSASSTITVTIKVTSVDERPELVGEAPEEYAENGTAAVATFTAADPEGKSITWTLGGADDADFSIENGVLRFVSSPDYEMPADQGTDNTYEVMIRASDGGDDTTATKEVSIDVTNVEEPGTIILSTLQPQVGRPLTATLTDPDNATDSTVTWQWYRGSSPISDAMDGAGGLVSSYTPAPGDVGSTLRAQAMYDDVEGEDKTAREDSHRNVRSAPQSNTDPVFPTTVGQTDTNQTREVAENTPAGTNLGAPIAANDAGDVLTYSLDNTGAMSFDINRATGQLTTKADLDFETGPTYTVTVTATDPFGAMDTSQVEITVSEVNEAPVLSGGAASMDRAENGTDLDEDATNNDQFTVTDEDTVDNAAVLRWSLSGADADKFQIGTTGGVTRTLSFKQAPAVPFLPDYEAPGDSGADNLYEVTVVVTDTKGNSDEQDVTVKVTNVEEPGTIMLSTLQPRVGFPVTAMLTDADNITAGSVSWQWYKGTVTQELLDTLDDRECVAATTNECFIKGATSATYTPVANDVNDTLLAVALYTDGSPNQDDAEDFAMMATATTVLADTRNKAPVFPDQDLEMDGDQTDQERSVLENTTANMPIGTTNNGSVTPDPVTALDSITTNIGGMTDEVLTYSLGGPDAASFSIDRSTAVLSTKAALDKETKDTYTVTVTATDPSGLTATITVTIKVTNEDEAPEIMLGGLGIDGMRSVRYAENGTDAVATYTAVGPESASTTWALSGDDAGDFDISGSGVLTFRSFPDYEAPRDADTNNEYKVTVQADDGTYMDTLNVTVTVTNVDEVPMTISAGPSDMEVYAENNTRVVATYMVAGSNAASAIWSDRGRPTRDVFDISNVGVLTFK